MTEPGPGDRAGRDSPCGGLDGLDHPARSRRARPPGSRGLDGLDQPRPVVSTGSTTRGVVSTGATIRPGLDGLDPPLPVASPGSATRYRARPTAGRPVAV